MKKWTLVHLFIVFLISSSSAHADIIVGTPLWDQTGLSGYTVVDRSGDLDESAALKLGYTGPDYSGYYVGTIEISSTPASGDVEFKKAINDYYFALTGSYFYVTSIDVVKAEDSTWVDDDLSVTLNPGGLSGSWTYDGEDLGLGFYGIKGSHEMSLFYVSPSDQSGIWTTRHILNQAGNIPSISHFSGVVTDYNPFDPGPTPVPEPTTVLLLGAGLLGLGLAARRHSRV